MLGLTVPLSRCRMQLLSHIPDTLFLTSLVMWLVGIHLFPNWVNGYLFIDLPFWTICSLKAETSIPKTDITGTTHGPLSTL